MADSLVTKALKNKVYITKIFCPTDLKDCIRLTVTENAIQKNKRKFYYKNDIATESFLESFSCITKTVVFVMQILSIIFCTYPALSTQINLIVKQLSKVNLFFLPLMCLKFYPDYVHVI